MEKKTAHQCQRSTMAPKRRSLYSYHHLNIYIFLQVHWSVVFSSIRGVGGGGGGEEPLVGRAATTCCWEAAAVHILCGGLFWVVMG
ncbi:hypothetical protein FKM82_026206 [Ascaphus truei]